MNSPSRTCVAVSGGRDSLLALCLAVESAKRHGGDVLALHALLLPERSGDALAQEGMRRVCSQLGVGLSVVDLREDFKRLVVGPFVAEYLAGRTPNPCTRCNAAIKFGMLWDAAQGLGADALATGHYARLHDHSVYGPALGKGADTTKDQSYFLSLVPRERLLRAAFPLADWRKADVLPELDRRSIATHALPGLSTESQDACFVPPGGYADFVESHIGAHLEAQGAPAIMAGPIELEDGRVVGRHAGLWRYTPGQRRGLAVAWTEPLYVLAKDVARNTLVVGPHSSLDAPGCVAGNVNLLTDPALWPAHVLVKTRYRQVAGPASWQWQESRLRLAFLAPQGRPAPGQVAVIYDIEGVVLAGGIIEA